MKKIFKTMYLIHLLIWSLHMSKVWGTHFFLLLLMLHAVCMSFFCPLTPRILTNNMNQLRHRGVWYSPTWATKNNLLTFDYAGCLIGILIQVYYNPYIQQITRFFSMAHVSPKWWYVLRCSTAAIVLVRRISKPSMVQNPWKGIFLFVQLNFPSTPQQKSKIMRNHLPQIEKKKLSKKWLFNLWKTSGGTSTSHKSANLGAPLKLSTRPCYTLPVGPQVKTQRFPHSPRMIIFPEDIPKKIRQGVFVGDFSFNEYPTFVGKTTKKYIV